MEKDKQKTLVIFKSELGGVVAIFPKLKYGFNGYRNDLVTCYSHIGQHSACAPEYFKNLPNAKEKEYLPLKKELENIGYNLTVKNK
jgi:hypothetical protein